MAAACAADFSSCLAPPSAATCCAAAGSLCLKRVGKQHAQCMPQRGHACVDSAEWLCPASWATSWASDSAASADAGGAALPANAAAASAVSWAHGKSELCAGSLRVPGAAAAVGGGEPEELFVMRNPGGAAVGTSHAGGGDAVHLKLDPVQHGSRAGNNEPAPRTSRHTLATSTGRP